MNDTRTQAHTAASLRAKAVRDRCITALSDAALTADEVATRIGESVLTVRPRITELLQAGTIVKTALRRANVSGRKAAVMMVPA